MQTIATPDGDLGRPLALALAAIGFSSLPALAGGAFARQVDPAFAPPAVFALASSTLDQALFDEPGDGRLWARGTAYKASFDAQGATIVPFFGSDAPFDHPLALRTDEVRLGASELNGRARAQVSRSGNVVSLDRGAFVEQYELALDSLEQRFVFPSLGGAGDLILRIDADSDLAGSDRGDTLSFENELGHVDYGEAFALDAAGRRIALDSTLVDGAIQIVVPADFVASATFPLTVDPLITFFTLSNFTLDEIDPDVAYDVSTDRWCVAWTSVWSATDHDVFAKLVSGAGVIQPTLLTIDFSGDSWSTPKIANNNQADLFLVCAGVAPMAGLPDVRGRFVLPGAVATGAVFPISPNDGFAHDAPDVGGDPYAGSPSYFAVVWQHHFSPSDVDLEMQLVAIDGTLHGGPFFLESSSTSAELPSLSNSTGEDSALSGSAWSVVWQQLTSLGNHDIWGAQVQWNGSVVHAKFPISTDASDETAPRVSTLLDALPNGSERPYLVVFQRAFGIGNDVAGVLLQGSLVLDQGNLSSNYEGAPIQEDQYAPSVDSDGSQFLVGYVERTTPTTADGDVWISNYYPSSGKIVLRDNRHTFAGSPADENGIALHSMASAGGPRQHFFGAWSYASANQGYDVQGGLWDGASSGWILKFCNGDGTGAPCPCGNTGGDERGCANSANPDGAVLDWTGDASVSADTLVLRASGLPPGVNCLFFQGTNSAGGLGAPFGDGKRCVFGAITRLGLKTSAGGAASFPELGDEGISAKGAVPFGGATRYYQAWYRDPASFCTSGTSNLTNGVVAIWAP